MKARLILGFSALVLGGVLIAVALSQRGTPWGFRDRAAVLVEQVGTVELTAGPHHRGASPGATVPGSKVTGLFAGDELRTSPLSMARVKTPSHLFKIGSGSQFRLEEDGGATFSRGQLTLDVPRSERVVRIRGGGGEVAFDEGSYDLVADGRAGNLFVFIRSGKAKVVNQSNMTPLVAGDLLRLAKGVATVGEPATNVGLKAQCRRGAGAGSSKPRMITGTAPPGTLLLVDGRLLYPANDSTFTVKLPPDEGQVVVFARAPGGNVAERSLRCGG